MVRRTSRRSANDCSQLIPGLDFPPIAEVESEEGKIPNVLTVMM